VGVYVCVWVVVFVECVCGVCVCVCGGVCVCVVCVWVVVFVECVCVCVWVCVIKLIVNFHMLCKCLGYTAPPLRSFYVFSVNIGCMINTATCLTCRQNCHFERDSRRKNLLHTIFYVAVVSIFAF